MTAAEIADRYAEVPQDLKDRDPPSGEFAAELSARQQNLERLGAFGGR